MAFFKNIWDGGSFYYFTSSFKRTKVSRRIAEKHQVLTQVTNLKHLSQIGKIKASSKKKSGKYFIALIIKFIIKIDHFLKNATFK